MFQTATDVVVRGALDGLAARNRSYAQNIANAETPGYQPVDVHFEDQLRKMRDKFAADPSSGVPSVNIAEVPDDQGADRPDDNGVQIDSQVVKLQENTIAYEALAQAAKIRDAMMRSAVTEGKK